MLPANRVSLDPDAFPDELTVWIGPKGALAVRTKDSAGGWSFIAPCDPKYPGFRGYTGSGFFLHCCDLAFDHNDLASPQDLIRAGDLVLANGAASLVVREGPFDHLTFVGLIGSAFDDSLHGRVRNAVVARRWAISTRSGEGPPRILYQAG